MATLGYLLHFANFGDNRLGPYLADLVARVHGDERPEAIRGVSRSLKYIGSSAVSKFFSDQERPAVFTAPEYHSELEDISHAAFDLMSVEAARDLNKRLDRISVALWSHASEAASVRTEAA
ncbi:hypothetical protein [Chelativorans sp. AA-79]|uniref:hypothetical protein n=1 Tax=Chelativorans sp. AA-79 TaxID=3028735 RepID=UPI0023F6627C|nr:hypothetical protein [Chelativorans sp. AA-79]WEX10305.1 hypothetical protein PVE73_04925 [Chelativorans sp. AA-79]